MDRELLAPFLAMVVLANVAGIAFVMSGRRMSFGTSRPTWVPRRRAAGPLRLRLADVPVPTAAAWERVLAAATIHDSARGRPATVVALRLVGLEMVAEREGAARAAQLRQLVRLTLRDATRQSDPLGWDGADTFAVLLRGADARRAAAYVERAVARLRPWTGGAAGGVQLVIDCVSPAAHVDLQRALDRAELRLAADRSLALHGSTPA
jgi:GGDEF domain-containing protein